MGPVWSWGGAPSSLFEGDFAAVFGLKLRILGEPRLTAGPGGETLMIVFRAVVRRKTGIAIETVPTRALRPGEVRVAVLGAALCRTDLAAADGRLKVPEGRILGHELAGEVLEAPGRELRVGARITANPLIPCGACSWCSKDPERCLQPKW